MELIYLLFLFINNLVLFSYAIKWFPFLGIQLPNLFSRLATMVGKLRFLYYLIFATLVVVAAILIDTEDSIPNRLVIDLAIIGFFFFLGNIFFALFTRHVLKRLKDQEITNKSTYRFVKLFFDTGRIVTFLIAYFSQYAMLYH